MRWDNYPQSSPSQVEDTARKPQLKVLEKTGPRVATVSGLEEQRGPSLQGQFKSIDVYALRCFHYPSAAGVLSGKEVPQTTSSISNTLCAMSLETELLGGHGNLCFQSLGDGEVETEAKDSVWRSSHFPPPAIDSG